MTLPDRIANKIDATGPCWLWLGCCMSNGYGTTWNPNGSSLAHRAVYELLVGPIPEGLELDHLCKVRHCVNPDHLEPVTHAENMRRGAGYGGYVNSAKTHCPQGHEYTDANTYVCPKGKRHCRICRANHGRNYRQSRRNS